MSPTAEELRAVQELSPETVRAYLLSNGWQARTEMPGAMLWTLTEGSDEFEVSLPTDQGLRDFGLRMFDVLRTLSVIEDRSFASVLADLANTSSDTLTFRLLPDGPPGTVPLLHGTDALYGVRELLLAATYASTLPQPLLVQGERPADVWGFARRVRLGTPQPGSWTIAAQLAIPTAEPEDPIDHDQPFARRVSLYAYRGVRATLIAAGEALRGDTVEPFLRRAQEGVSANMCTALAKLGHDDTPFEVRFAWAQHLPAQVGAGRFRFDRNVIRAVRNAAQAIRTSSLDGQLEMTGMVSRLSRGNAGVGNVVIHGRVRSRHGEAEQKLTVRLAGAHHQTAIEAYRLRQPVRLIAQARSGHIDAILSIDIVPSHTAD